MYIQNLVKSLTVFCIMLMICLPISLALETGWVEEEKSTLFTINVKYYEPRPLTSSTIEKGNAPIYVHLAGMPIGTLSVPRIQSVDYRETGTNVLIGGIEYKRPILYSWDDFGYLIVRLRQIPKETDVPDTIIANITARFRYEVDAVPGLVGGVTSTALKEVNEGDLKETEGEGKEKRERFSLVKVKDKAFEFFGGYITAVDIKKDSAKFIVFNKEGRDYTRTVREGEESIPIYLVPGSKRPQDLVRIRVENIGDNIVDVTLFAGMEKGETEISFRLVIPIEKRPFNLTPQEIDNQINWTNSTIEMLDGWIENLNGLVEWYSAACIISFGIALMGSLFGLRADPAGAAVSGTATGKAIVDVTGMAGEGSGSAATEETTTGQAHPCETGRIFTSYHEGEKLYIIPIDDVSRLSLDFAQVRKYNAEGRKIYAAYKQIGAKECLIKFYVCNGKEIDCGLRRSTDPIDNILRSYDKLTECEAFAPIVKGISRAEATGTNKVSNPFGTGTLTLQTRDILQQEATPLCTDFMSKGQCSLIFNFCDPVLCSTSRCNFGGSYTLEKSVQESGLFPSVFACIQNFGVPMKEPKWHAVHMPFCLTGIRDSLENIKSNIEEYQWCLGELKEGKSVGICDTIRSIFICELVWRHLLDPMFGLLFERTGRALSRSSGGGGDVIEPGKIQRAKKVSKYFTDVYAKRIIGAYKGKISEAVGTELCRSAIEWKLPNFGEILAELAEGGKPTSYTARFSELSYSEAAGQSRYSGNFHIHVGSKTETVNYFVYLKNCGEQERLDTRKRGEIKGGDWAAESFEVIGASGCKEICLNINNEAFCAFGKVLSSSDLIERTSEIYVARQAGKEITSERECVPQPHEAYFAAAINRQCASFDPDGPGKKWVKVGSCSPQPPEVKCYAEISTADVRLQARTECKIQGGDSLCTGNQICGGREIKTDDGKYICCKGKCKEGVEEGVTIAPKPEAPSPPAQPPIVAPGEEPKAPPELTLDSPISELERDDLFTTKDLNSYRVLRVEKTTTIPVKIEIYVTTGTTWRQGIPLISEEPHTKLKDVEAVIIEIKRP